MQPAITSLVEFRLATAGASTLTFAKIIRIESPMNNLLHHPVRVAMILVGILCAISSFTFFRTPVVMIPYIPIVVQFITSTQRFLTVIGWLLLSLVITSFIIGRIEIEGFRFEKFVVYGGPLLLLSAGFHLLLSKSQKGTKTNPQQ